MLLNEFLPKKPVKEATGLGGIKLPADLDIGLSGPADDYDPATGELLSEPLKVFDKAPTPTGRDNTSAESLPFDPRNKNLGLEPGGITNQPIGGRGLEAGGMNAGISGYPGGRNWQGDDEANFITRMKNNAGLSGTEGGGFGTPKKGDDNAEWYNSPGTKMGRDTAKYADTGEAPEIEKPQGNLLNWMARKSNKAKKAQQGVMTGGVPDSVNK